MKLRATELMMLLAGQKLKLGIHSYKIVLSCYFVPEVKSLDDVMSKATGRR